VCVYFLFSLCFWGVVFLCSFLLQYFDAVGCLLTCKNRLPYNLYCVGGDVKHCSIQSKSHWQSVKYFGWGTGKFGSRGRATLWQCRGSVPKSLKQKGFSSSRTEILDISNQQIVIFEHLKTFWESFGRDTVFPRCLCHRDVYFSLDAAHGVCIILNFLVSSQSVIVTCL